MDSDIEDVIKILIEEIKEGIEDKCRTEVSKDTHWSSQVRIAKQTVAGTIFKELTYDQTSSSYKMSDETYNRLHNQYLKG